MFPLSSLAVAEEVLSAVNGANVEVFLLFHTVFSHVCGLLGIVFFLCFCCGFNKVDYIKQYIGMHYGKCGVLFTFWIGSVRLVSQS